MLFPSTLVGCALGVTEAKLSATSQPRSRYPTITRTLILPCEESPPCAHFQESGRPSPFWLQQPTSVMMLFTLRTISLSMVALFVSQVTALPSESLVVQCEFVRSIWTETGGDVNGNSTISHWLLSFSHHVRTARSYSTHHVLYLLGHRPNRI